MKLISYLSAFIFVSIVMSPLLVWYDYLWLPRQHLAYWSQILPLSCMIILLLTIFKKGLFSYLISIPMRLLFIASIIVQTLVWINVLHLPLF